MTSDGAWSEGPLPPNVRAGAGTLITGDVAFKRFRNRRDLGLRIGAIHLVVFAGFSAWYLGQPLKWNHWAGFALIAVAAWLIFLDA